MDGTNDLLCICIIYQYIELFYLDAISHHHLGKSQQFTNLNLAAIKGDDLIIISLINHDSRARSNSEVAMKLSTMINHNSPLLIINKYYPILDV